MEAGVFSVRVWINTSTIDQTGPARIFTWSRSSLRRNLTIGQVAGNFILRCRFSDEGQQRGGWISNGMDQWQDPITTNDEPLRVGEDMQLVARLDEEGSLSLWVNDRAYVPNEAGRIAIEMLNADNTCWTNEGVRVSPGTQETIEDLRADSRRGSGERLMEASEAYQRLLSNLGAQYREWQRQAVGRRPYSA